MGKPVDSQRRKVYAAEAEAFRGTEWTEIIGSGSMEEIREYLERITSHQWFKERWPRIGEFILHNGGGGYRSTASFRGLLPRISVIRDQRNPWTVVHELCHICTWGDQVAAHGREFCAAYLLLVKHYFGADMEKRLRQAFIKHKVKYKPKVQLSEEEKERRRQAFLEVRAKSAGESVAQAVAATTAPAAKQQARPRWHPQSGIDDSMASGMAFMAERSLRHLLRQAPISMLATDEEKSALLAAADALASLQKRADELA
jgi:putative metallohydrolase (TIGR04338 family)